MIPGPEMAGSVRADTPFERWERWQQLAVTVVPYALLAVSAVATIVLDPILRRPLLPDLGLAAAAGAWMLWLHTLHPRWRERPRVMMVFFTGLIVLMAVLVVRDPWFGFFAFSGYLFVYNLPLSRWRMLGVLAVAVIAATAQDGGLPQPRPPTLAIYGMIVLVNMALAGGITWFTWVREEQNHQRLQALAELAEANRKLEATVAENAGLHEQLLVQAREAGVLDERQRLAREIHDTLAQGLTGIITQLEAVAQPGRPDADRRHHLGSALRLARDSLTEARRSVDALRPEPLECARLPEALAEVTRWWSELSGVPAQVTITGTARPLRPEVEAALLRTAQEALANVAKHAAASRAGLTLSYMGDEVALDVRDDGAGFLAGGNGTGNGAAPAGRGFGLTAMRQRAEALAGTLEIESEPGAGTAVSARFPVPPEGAV